MRRQYFPVFVIYGVVLDTLQNVPLSGFTINDINMYF